ncbi:hypothetical protein PENSUB_3243 [Penicillium subrubescens]|uniref:Uncharacterized protein n=1 Tax=Penicillium subrubescens TaxID=1316194 RepID=A0A1Q5UFG5_9EURO|nr:hypothetical protein PENSUB_3243 [Penicillium subrubescens]
MAYCLWDALKMQELREGTLSDSLLYEAESTLRKLTAFLSTRLCLRWFELSTIINYTGNFEQLLDRIIEALEIPEKENERMWGRLRFLRGWKSAVLQTTPWALLAGRSERFWEETYERPIYIDGDTGYEAMQIAQAWSVKLKMFSTDRRGDAAGSTARYMCPKCLGVMSMKDIRKHQLIECR